MRPQKIYFQKIGMQTKSSQSLKEVIEMLLDGNYEIVLKIEKHIRSIEQNNWYWSIIGFLVKNTEYGYTKEEWHDTFGQEFLKIEWKGVTGNIYTKVRSTTDLDTDEFSEYIEKILIFCETFLKIPRKFLLPKLKGLEPPF